MNKKDLELEPEIVIDEEPKETEENDPYGCETIYCEPVCESCGADEGKCSYNCKKNGDLDQEPDLETEPDEDDNIEYEPSGDFCWTHKSDHSDDEWEDNCQRAMN